MRVTLYEAAQGMWRSKKWSWLKAWAMPDRQAPRHEKGDAALACRLVVIIYRIRVDGAEFRWTPETAMA